MQQFLPFRIKLQLGSKHLSCSQIYESKQESSCNSNPCRNRAKVDAMMSTSSEDSSAIQIPAANHDRIRALIAPPDDLTLDSTRSCNNLECRRNKTSVQMRGFTSFRRKLDDRSGEACGWNWSFLGYRRTFVTGDGHSQGNYRPVSLTGRRELSPRASLLAVFRGRVNLQGTGCT